MLRSVYFLFINTRDRSNSTGYHFSRILVFHSLFSFPLSLSLSLCSDCEIIFLSLKWQFRTLSYTVLSASKLLSVIFNNKCWLPTEIYKQNRSLISIIYRNYLETMPYRLLEQSIDNRLVEKFHTSMGSNVQNYVKNARCWNSSRAC